jgi:hypothetical protein
MVDDAGTATSQPAKELGIRYAAHAALTTVTDVSRVTATALPSVRRHASKRGDGQCRVGGRDEVVLDRSSRTEAGLLCWEGLVSGRAVSAETSCRAVPDSTGVVPNSTVRATLTMPRPDPLRRSLREIWSLEVGNARDLAALAPRFEESAQLSTLVSDVASLATTHAQTIERRLATLGAPHETSSLVARGAPIQGAPAPPGSLSRLLEYVYGRIHETVIRYAALQSVATRFGDSWIVASEGTAAHLARQHTQDYLAASGRVTQILHDVVLAELDRAGFPCQCTCPGCGAGICLCAVGGRTILGEAWASARPIPFEDGIEVQEPRPGSPAERAGLKRGTSSSGPTGSRSTPRQCSSPQLSIFRPVSAWELLCGAMARTCRSRSHTQTSPLSLATCRETRTIVFGRPALRSIEVAHVTSSIASAGWPMVRHPAALPDSPHANSKWYVSWRAAPPILLLPSAFTSPVPRLRGISPTYLGS